MYRMYECRGRMDAQERPQRSGRVTGFKRFPVDQAASDHRFPVFARPPGASLSSAIPTVIGNPRRGLRYERSEEHTSELQSLMRISYAVFCLKKKIKK